MFKVKPIIVLALIVLLTMAISPTYAGDTVLSNNSGDANVVWFVQGEASLVMNGFDLSQLNLQFPVAVDAVSISVNAPVPGIPIDVVIYQDADGGSPSNAVLVARTQTTIDQPGTARVTFSPAVIITNPVIWVGFYLPVDFKFNADNSGASVLTYWGWNPSGAFDLANLAVAPVLGPADGSAPVNINMGGIARISAELITSGSSNATTDPSVTSAIGIQLVDESNTDLSPLRQYEFCGSLYYDIQDVQLTARDGFDLYCRVGYDPMIPTGLIPNTNFERRGFYYDVSAFGNYQRDPNNAELLVNAVTHCIRPATDDLNRAVIGIAYGSPREWHVMPTVRFGEYVCAEMSHVGNIAYFVPRGSNEPNENANLVFSKQPVIAPQPFICGRESKITIFVINNGSEVPLAASRVFIRDIHVRTGALVKEVSFTIPTVRPGETLKFEYPFEVSVYVNELHRTVIILDAGSHISELNEGDNVNVSEYILQPDKITCPQ